MTTNEDAADGTEEPLGPQQLPAPLSPLHPDDPPLIGGFWLDARVLATESGVAYAAHESPTGHPDALVIVLSEGASRDPAARERLAGVVNQLELDTVIARGGQGQDTGRLARRFRPEPGTASQTSVGQATHGQTVLSQTTHGQAPLAPGRAQGTTPALPGPPHLDATAPPAPSGTPQLKATATPASPSTPQLDTNPTAPWVALAFDGSLAAADEARRILSEVDLSRLGAQGRPSGPDYEHYWIEQGRPGGWRAWPLPWPGRPERAGWLSILASWVLMMLLMCLAVTIAILLFQNAPQQSAPPPVPTSASGSGSPPPSSSSASPSESTSASPSDSASASPSQSPSSASESPSSPSPSPSASQTASASPTPSASGSPGGTPTQNPRL